MRLVATEGEVMARRILLALRKRNPLGCSGVSPERRMLFDMKLCDLIDQFGFDWSYVGYTKKMMVIGIEVWDKEKVKS